MVEGMTADAAFVALAVLTVLTAILALEARELVYGAVSLALTFLGVAGIFIILDASFVALLQVLVFVGGVAILILFTVMLVRRETWLKVRPSPERFFGAFAALVLALGVSYIALLSGLGAWTPPAGGPSFTDIGIQLVVDYWPVLHVLGIALGAAAVGSLTLAKLEKREESSP